MLDPSVWLRTGQLLVDQLVGLHQLDDLPGEHVAAAAGAGVDHHLRAAGHPIRHAAALQTAAGQRERAAAVPISMLRRDNLRQCPSLALRFRRVAADCRVENRVACTDFRRRCP